MNVNEDVISPVEAQRAHWGSTFASNPQMYGGGASEPGRYAAELFAAAGCREVLELGSGQGRDTLALLEGGTSVHAVDYSTGALDQLAGQVGAAQAERLTTVAHDVRQPLPFPDHAFDAATSLLVRHRPSTPRPFHVTIGDMINEPVRAGGRPYRMVARADAARATASRLLDVAVNLFTEKAYDDVSLDEVASRAGVTRRTLLRRFESKERLFVAGMNRATAVMISMRDAAPVGDIDGAVANVVEQYEEWGLNRLRLLSQEGRIPVVTENVEGGRRYHWSWVERSFDPIVKGLRGAARKRRIASIVAITDVYMWKLLRRDLGLSRADTERILVELITKLQGEG